MLYKVIIGSTKVDVTAAARAIRDLLDSGTMARLPAALAAAVLQTNDAVLVGLFDSAVFEPGLPLQVTVQSTTPASQSICELGPCASAADALHAAAEHYSLAEASEQDAEDDQVRMEHLSERILLWLDLGGAPHFGARLPSDYKPALKPATVAIGPGGFGS